MTPVPDSNSDNHILIAVNTSRGSLLPMEFAVTLAAHWSVRLDTLLVEDIGLFHFAELPFAKELNAQSGELTSFNTQDANRAGHLQSSRVRRKLDDATARLRIKTTMTTVRGQYLNETLSAMNNANIVFLSPRSSMSRERSFELYPQRPPLLSVKKGRSIVVYFDDSEDASRALAVAVELAVETDKTLIILLGIDMAKLNQPGKPRAPVRAIQSNTAQTLNELQHKADSLVRLQRIAMNLPEVMCQYRSLDTTLTGDLTNTQGSNHSNLYWVIQRYGADLLVITHQQFTDNPSSQAQLNRLPCPLLLVCAPTNSMKKDNKNDNDLGAD